MYIPVNEWEIFPFTFRLPKPFACFASAHLCKRYSTYHYISIHRVFVEHKCIEASEKTANWLRNGRGLSWPLLCGCVHVCSFSYGHVH